ncbi:uncharacterized protein BXZ73DRAFT_79216 [Epithele typhae]|uniref:uncharacterized protein n=1 Tax=Epithele typhae TaxID=378194 RepID=UPI002008AE24|nr:uncharacterized protein BXZ73DRAFT_79216 [Epithele typhae]KAH9924659.1 hypothetical protein BXZ73DRAFT_79216 [Epithele typhae]
MSLPTPPGTSHRDEKENWAPRFSRVQWREAAQYHPITSSPPRLTTRPSALKAGPSRSILKKINLPSPSPAFVKEVTPEPEDPLANLDYLQHPVSTIIALDVPLSDTINAYTSLMARLRNCVSGNTDADASWPLFQPLRKHREQIVGALVRDIRQAFAEPLAGSSSITESPSTPVLREAPSTSSLPSPCESPKKKKRGMSEEQVKRARDFCGVCQAAIKLLGLVFTLPAVYNVFEESELGFILTQVVAIPLARDIPTPNARKTCALAIWLIQTQRLPAEVLEPAKDRIAYALRRGIDGELGKEGKKGSVSDGLKAVHDLAVYQPATFVPAFAPILSSILDNLMAPSLVIRNQACHALGGLAIAAASLPPSEAHTLMSVAVTSRLVKDRNPSATTPTQRKIDASPTKDPILVRTLRTTLQATEPKHAAQGPVWAFSVIAHLAVLLGPTVFLHKDLTRTMCNLFHLGMRHQRSSARALGCLAWRAMTWSYFRPPHVKITFDEDTENEEEPATEDDIEAERKEHQASLRSSFKALTSVVVDMGAGINIVGALLGNDVLEGLQAFGALRMLRSMSRKGGFASKDALDVVRHLLSGAAAKPSEVEDTEWDHNKLLVSDFFSANPGLLTAEWRTLSSVVRSLLEQCPTIEDIRPFTLEEASTPGMWEECLQIWRGGLGVLRLVWGDEAIPSEIREVWFSLLKCHAAPLLDDGDHHGLAKLAVKVRDVLVDILDDPDLDFIARKDDGDLDLLTSPVKAHGADDVDLLPGHRQNYAVKLFLVRDLFTITRAVFPTDVFAELSESMLRHLIVHEEALLGDVESADQVREQWSCICADAAFAGEPAIIQSFFNNNLRKAYRKSDWGVEIRADVWHAFCQQWAGGGSPCSFTWDAAVILLAAPFVDTSCWDLRTEDLEVWTRFLPHALGIGMDQGADVNSLVDQIAGAITGNQGPSTINTVRIADQLLCNTELMDACSLPATTLYFTNDTLYAAYPAEPKHKVICMWLIRSVTHLVDKCPQKLCLMLLELLAESISTWVTDDLHICSEEEYSSDILPLYQTVLVSLQELPPCLDILEKMAPVLAAPFQGRKDRHVGAVDAFAEFWQAAYAAMPEPATGYPELVAQCLDAVSQARLEQQEDEAKVEDMTALLSETPSPVAEVKKTAVTQELMEIDACESEDEGSVVIPSPGTLLQGFDASRTRDAPTRALSTPPSSPRALAPTRPHKSGIKVHDPEDIDGSSPLRFSVGRSPPRTPTTPKRPTSKVNKENVSPTLLSASVAERLSARSPLLLESLLGKRVRVDEPEDAADLEVKAFKKGRLEPSPLAPSPLANVPVHAVTLACNPSIPMLSTKATSSAAVAKLLADVDDSNSVMNSPTVASRKRKGVFVEAVEVPPLNVVLKEWRRSRSLPSVSASESEPSTSAVRLDSTKGDESLQPTIRRTRSATKLLGGPVDFQRLTTPKKRRTNRVQDLREEARHLLSSPSNKSIDEPLFGSDDSIMMATPHRQSSDLLASDDDPHLGQVTPHRLVSPAVRRIQQQTCLFTHDPPSDDSDLVESPTSERISRKIARLGGQVSTPKALLFGGGRL